MLGVENKNFGHDLQKEYIFILYLIAKFLNNKASIKKQKFMGET